MQGIIKNVCLTNKGICNVKVTMIKVSVILNLIMIRIRIRFCCDAGFKIS